MLRKGNEVCFCFCLCRFFLSFQAQTFLFFIAPGTLFRLLTNLHATAVARFLQRLYWANTPPVHTYIDANRSKVHE